MSLYVKPGRKAGGVGEWVWVLIQVVVCKRPLILEQL